MRNIVGIFLVLSKRIKNDNRPQMLSWAPPNLSLQSIQEKLCTT